ncbi:MAG TPA: hypothetical protein P5136_01425 [Methanofastidiosum sp.]|nr:hypothetical protein [Methanofastidiosum sp.]
MGMKDKLIELLEKGEIKEALKILKDKRYLFIVWSIEDVYATAEQMNRKITKKEAVTVLENLGHNHDATIGINWDVIESTIESLN